MTLVTIGLPVEDLLGDRGPESEERVKTIGACVAGNAVFDDGDKFTEENLLVTAVVGDEGVLRTRCC